MKIRLNLKRIFDIFFSTGLILALSPLFILVMIIIRLESRGPIFYYSLRVGRNYKVFKFYKFRSMIQNADHLLNSLTDQNQYSTNNLKCDTKFKDQGPSQIETKDINKLIVGNNGIISIDDFELSKKESNKNSFVKILNDPRITKFGAFIRKTSIDELPQLFNVLKGDMSIVGNRPLPLYEAEKLTRNDAVQRFDAPAGITGLWQVTERGKSKMDPLKRVLLDCKYARNHSFLGDMKILIKTLPAAIQHENV